MSNITIELLDYVYDGANIDWDKSVVRTWERRETKKPKTMSKLDSQISAWQEAKKLL